MKLRLFSIAMLVLAGCDTDPLPATGSLSRPSGLAHVARVDENGALRSDVMIADTEAGGLRVVQLRRTVNSEGEINDDHTFLRSTALFFPLVVPAGKAPTRVAASSDGQRVYVLSPVENVLHVLETEQADYGASATQTDSFLPLGQISLQNNGTDLGLPVDLIVLPPRDTSELDLILVAFDGIEGDSMLGAYSATSPGVGRYVDSATVAPGPRSLAVRTATPSPGVLLSSSGGSFVSLVELDRQNGDDILGATRLLDAGGPTGEIVDAGRSGALALRLDRIAATIFDVDSGELARSQRVIRSPFTPDEELSLPAHRGVVDLRGSPPIAAVHTTLRVLPGQGVPVVRDFGERGGDVVAIVHADTLVSFIAGPPLDLSFVRPSRISRVDASNNGDLEGCGEPAPISCEEREEREIQGSAPPDPMCLTGVLTTSVSARRVLRAEYRGTMIRDSGGELTRTSTALDFELIPRFAVFSDFPLRPGDNVLIQGRFPLDCKTASTAADVVAVGSLTSTGAETIGVSFAATSAVGRFADCPSDVRFTLAEYEIFPSRPEVVYSQLTAILPGQAPRVGRVLARIPTTDQQGGSVSTSSTVEAPINLNFSASSSFFTCTGTVPAAGRLCSSSLECGSGRECEPSSFADCPGTCTVECIEGAANCLDQPVERGACTAVEIEVSQAEGNFAETAIELANQGFISAVADDVVFSPMRGSWIISFPGARALLELQTDASQGFAVRAIR